MFVQTWAQTRPSVEQHCAELIWLWCDSGRCLVEKWRKSGRVRQTWAELANFAEKRRGKAATQSCLNVFLRNAVLVKKQK